MQQRPTIADTFNTWQAGKHKTGAVKKWVEWFPVQQEVLDGAKDDAMAVTIVDVGGGRGRNVMAFRKKSPDAPSRFIFEDLKHTVDSVASSGDMEGLAYDFFTPQPIKG